MESDGDVGEGSARRGGGNGRGIGGVRGGIARALGLLRLSSFRAPLEKETDLVAGRGRRGRVLGRGDGDGRRRRRDVDGDARGDELGGPGGPDGGVDARSHPDCGRGDWRAVRDSRAGLRGGRGEAGGSLRRGTRRCSSTVSPRGGVVA